MSNRELWRADVETKRSSRIQQYIDWLEERNILSAKNYDELWNWSIERPKLFWKSIYDYFEVIDRGCLDELMSEEPMPNCSWFNGSKVNYAEHIFRSKSEEYPAIIYKTEKEDPAEMSWEELKDQVSRFQTWLTSKGVKRGDRVVAFLPNIKEASIAFLATNALGAIWSSCSPDFGFESLLDRFSQIEPKILIACDGYTYGGKPFNRLDVVEKLADTLTSLEEVVLVPFLNQEVSSKRFVSWAACLVERSELRFEAVPFDHPIWILFSSGTTGRPKAITHSHGGVLLEHLKYLAFHNDVKPGERFFWYSTTGWMMWNFLHASWLVGATVVLYEGNPAYPDLNMLWSFVEEVKINHFGTSAPYLVACMKKGLRPKDSFDLSNMRSIGSTGAPLPPEAFDWCYAHVKNDLWLCSMSGGTDVCTAFVGSCILEPVYEGEIQVRGLGCALYAFDHNGEAITDAVGEMVIAKPMPSMPIYFWNDTDNQRYLASYFEDYQGIWRHGDFVKVTRRGSVIILGRSDATLNRHGVRIGTAEIYRALNNLEAIDDSIIVNIERADGSHYMPLFVKLKGKGKLSESLISEICQLLKTTYSPRHIPDHIIQVDDIPYTISGKKLEAPVKKILMGMPLDKVANPDALRNPESLQFFMEFRRELA